MATGDQNDIVGRLRAVLPFSWFPGTAAGSPSTTPILDGLLAGIAAVWVWAYAFLQYAIKQTRIATATGVFLDIIAGDFFNGWIVRRKAESDAVFLGRIKSELLREKATRAGLIRALTDLTGNAPLIFEPAYPMDTGAYAASPVTTGMGLAYGAAPGTGFPGIGGYGSLLLPFQFFVQAFRPEGDGVAFVGGYYTGSGWAGGGYGVGALEYVTLAIASSGISDEQIYAEINDVRPVCSIAWTAIENFQSLGAPTGIINVWNFLDANLSWTAASGTVYYYNIYYRRYPTGAAPPNWSLAGTTLLTSFGFPLPHHLSHTVIDFRINAVGVFGEGPSAYLFDAPH